VLVLTVVAEELWTEVGSTLYIEECDGYNAAKALEVLSEFGEVMKKEPVLTDIVRMRIDLEERTRVNSQLSYCLPD